MHRPNAIRLSSLGAASFCIVAHLPGGQNPEHRHACAAPKLSVVWLGMAGAAASLGLGTFGAHFRTATCLTILDSLPSERVLLHRTRLLGFAMRGLVVLRSLASHCPL